MSLERKEQLKEQAKDDCFVRFGTPTPGVDHSNHYEKIPYETLKEVDKEIE